MKQILKYMIPCLTAVFALTSCYDTMDDKADIDAKYYQVPTATVTLSAASATDFQTISATADFTGGSEILEEGIQITTDSTFVKVLKTVANDTIDASFTATVDGLSELTTYYVRAYAVTIAGGTVVSKVQTITTPKAPIFELAGTYTATEFVLDAKKGLQNSGSYEMTIAFAENSTTDVLITNLWGAGTTLKGTYNEATHTINVPNGQLLYTDDTYGPLNIIGVKDDDSASTDGVTFTFTPLGGLMKSTCFEALITTGDYAGYTLNYPTYVEMVHQ